MLNIWKKEEEKLGIRDLNLNNRQKQLLNYLLRKDNHTTIAMHKSIYGVTKLTASKDLQKLEALGFLSSIKVGTERRYSLAEKYKSLDLD